MPSRAQIKNPKTFFMEIGRLRETVKVCVIFYSVLNVFFAYHRAAPRLPTFLVFI